MRRYLSSIILLIILFSLAACSTIHLNEADDISNYIIEENEHQRLILPISKFPVHIDEDFIDLLCDIDVNMLKNAEKSIIDQVSHYLDKPYFYLEASEDKRLYLGAEVIVDIDPAYAPSGGCEDHEHKFFKEPITK